MNNREQSLYRARVCAVVSLVLFVAVVAAGSLRSAAESPDRTEAVYMASYRIESFDMKCHFSKPLENRSFRY